MPNIWIASFNKGKLKEFTKLLEELPFEVRSAGEFKFYTPPKETGQTFLANAAIKAEAFKPLAEAGDWVIGEDSGILVDALGGLPGVHSARYAGPKASDVQNNDKLLKMLGFKQTDNRKAHYHCHIVALGPNDARIEVSGDCHGEITIAPKGKGGFGYDPIFKPDGFDKTAGELTPREKRSVSHRAKACAEFLKQMSELSR